MCPIRSAPLSITSVQSAPAVEETFSKIRQTDIASLQGSQGLCIPRIHKPSHELPVSNSAVHQDEADDPQVFSFDEELPGSSGDDDLVLEELFFFCADAEGGILSDGWKVELNI